MKKQTLMTIDRATDLGTIMKNVDQVMQEKDLTIKQIQLIPQENFIGAFVVFNEKKDPTEEPKKRKTYTEDFLEKFPKAIKYTAGGTRPAFCRSNIYNGGFEDQHYCNTTTCKVCWDEEMEE